MWARMAMWSFPNINLLRGQSLHVIRKIVGYANVLNSGNEAIYKTNMRGQQRKTHELVYSKHAPSSRSNMRTSTERHIIYCPIILWLVLLIDNWNNWEFGFLACGTRASLQMCIWCIWVSIGVTILQFTLISYHPNGQVAIISLYIPLYLWSNELGVIFVCRV